MSDEPLPDNLGPTWDQPDADPLGDIQKVVDQYTKIAGVPPSVTPRPVLDWVPSTADVPIAEPPDSRTQTLYFLVKTTVTEPPPDAAENTLRILRKEMRFCLGNQAEVEEVFRTRSGRIITNDDVQEWADNNG
jgi:hypothetical protein